MDFELKALSFDSCAEWAADALLVLVPQDRPDAPSTASDPLSALIEAARQQGDLGADVGACLSAYRPAGFKAARLVLVQAGDGSPRSVRKAVAAGTLHLGVHDLRAWTSDRHHTVDDTPYGGGAGMVMKPEPWGEALALSSLRVDRICVTWMVASISITWVPGGR